MVQKKLQGMVLFGMPLSGIHLAFRNAYADEERSASRVLIQVDRAEM